MATGASNADLAVLLVDAQNGILTQTRRHAYIVSLLGIRHVVLAVNKIDLIGFDEERFVDIRNEFAEFARPLGFETLVTIPLSARHGDNVIAPSPRTPWYGGPSLLAHLEQVEVADGPADGPFRLPVQWVNRPNAGFRGYAGTSRAGAVRPGDTVVVARTGQIGARRAPGCDGRRPGGSCRRRCGDRHHRCRDRHQPRRRAGLAGSSPGDIRSDRRPSHLDGGRAAAPRPLLSAQGRRPHGRRRHQRAEASGRYRQLQAAGRQDADAQRHRPRQSVALRADRLRPLRRQPHHRLVHPHRPLFQRHRRRRHDPLRSAPRHQRPLAGARREQAGARRGARAEAGESCGSPACRVPASRPSPTWSRRS